VQGVLPDLFSFEERLAAARLPTAILSLRLRQGHSRRRLFVPHQMSSCPDAILAISSEWWIAGSSPAMTTKGG
jgi:hypothetical protein